MIIDHASGSVVMAGIRLQYRLAGTAGPAGDP
jgi:hypothetical protein